MLILLQKVPSVKPAKQNGGTRVLMPFKKGMKPHNKGDTYVKGNYRDKPMKKKMPKDDLYANMSGGNYYEKLGNSFMKRWGLGKY